MRNRCPQPNWPSCVTDLHHRRDQTDLSRLVTLIDARLQQDHLLDPRNDNADYYLIQGPSGRRTGVDAAASHGRIRTAHGVRHPLRDRPAPVCGRGSLSRRVAQRRNAGRESVLTAARSRRGAHRCSGEAKNRYARHSSIWPALVWRRAAWWSRRMTAPCTTSTSCGRSIRKAPAWPRSAAPYRRRSWIVHVPRSMAVMRPGQRRCCARREPWGLPAKSMD